ncbi:MAG: anti-sigma factor antagonist [Clostridia bacterium]|nr:anti-sigma factor antagonist [Clostridia bacterium]
MEIDFKRCERDLIVRITGEIDSESVKWLRGRIDVEYDEVKVKNLVFDFSGVGFMDSSGIGMIIGRYKRVSALGGSVKIFGADTCVRRIIELSGLENIVELYESEDAATKRREWA